MEKSLLYQMRVYLCWTMDLSTKYITVSFDFSVHYLPPSPACCKFNLGSGVVASTLPYKIASLRSVGPRAGRGGGQRLVVFLLVVICALFAFLFLLFDLLKNAVGRAARGCL